MKIVTRLFSVLLLMSFLNVFTSCKKSSDSPIVSGINPFSNGGSERNMIVVISDMHMGADMAYTECKNNLGPLVKLLQQIRTAPNVKELVIAGDLIDEWFVPANINTYLGKDQGDFVLRLAAANSGVFAALNQIIQEKKILVTYVPGNHDLGITAASVELILPGVNQARDARGLGTYIPASLPILAIEHGHRFNFACAPDPISNKDSVPGSILPFGYFYTRIAVLHFMQNCTVAGDTLAVITPNVSGNGSQQLAYFYWKICKTVLFNTPITNKFSEKIILTNSNGFTKTYSINDILPFQLTPGGFIDMNLYRGVQDNWEERQTINNVAVHIPVASALANQRNVDSIDIQANTQYFTNPNSNKRIVVFGHTHVARIMPFTNNGIKSIYANSGTWIDEKSGAGGTTMNFVVITPQGSNVSSQTYVKIYNFEGEVVNKMAEDSLRY